MFFPGVLWMGIFHVIFCLGCGCCIGVCVIEGEQNFCKIEHVEFLTKTRDGENFKQSIVRGEYTYEVPRQLISGLKIF